MEVNERPSEDLEKPPPYTQAVEQRIIAEEKYNKAKHDEEELERVLAEARAERIEFERQFTLAKAQEVRAKTAEDLEIARQTTKGNNISPDQDKKTSTNNEEKYLTHPDTAKKIVDLYGFSVDELRKNGYTKSTIGPGNNDKETTIMVAKALDGKLLQFTHETELSTRMIDGITRQSVQLKIRELGTNNPNEFVYSSSQPDNRVNKFIYKTSFSGDENQIRIFISKARNIVSSPIETQKMRQEAETRLIAGQKQMEHTGMSASIGTPTELNALNNLIPPYAVSR